MHRNDQLRAREAKRGVFSRTAVPSGDEPEAEAASEEDRALAAMFAGDDDGAGGGAERGREAVNPNNCATCRYKALADGGHCYMFRDEPTEICMQHTGRRVLILGQQGGIVAAVASILAQQPRCPHCDGTGDVHRADGEWLGRCTCPAGAASDDGLVQTSAKENGNG